MISYLIVSEKCFIHKCNVLKFVILYMFFSNCTITQDTNQQEGQRCHKRRVAQAAIRLATAVITFRNKERNFRASFKVNVLRHAKKCKTCNLGYIIVSML